MSEKLKSKFLKECTEKFKGKPYRINLSHKDMWQWIENNCLPSPSEGVSKTEAWDEMKTVIYESIGQASMCWGETPKGVFDDQQAISIGVKLENAVQVYASQFKSQQDSKVHKTHCYQGEYKTSCKYGDNNCPAKQDSKEVTEELDMKLFHIANELAIMGYGDLAVRLHRIENEFVKLTNH